MDIDSTLVLSVPDVELASKTATVIAETPELLNCDATPTVSDVGDVLKLHVVGGQNDSIPPSPRSAALVAADVTADKDVNESAAQTATPPEERVPKDHRAIHLGIHRVVYTPTPPFNLHSRRPSIDRLKTAYQHLRGARWFLGQVWNESPALCLRWLCLEVLLAVRYRTSNHASEDLFNAIETSRNSGRVDRKKIAGLLLASTFLDFVEIWGSGKRRQAQSRLAQRARGHLEYLELCANLLRTSKGKPSSSKTDIPGLINDVFETATSLVSVLSDVAYTWRLLTQRGNKRLGSAVLVLIFARWALTFTRSRFWTGSYLYHVVDANALRRILMSWYGTNSDILEEVGTLNMEDCVKSEYEKAYLALKGVDEEAIWEGMYPRKPIRDWLINCFENWPLHGYSIGTLIGWKGPSWATLWMLNNTSHALQNDLTVLFGTGNRSISTLLSRMNTVFTSAQSLEDASVDSAQAYPPAEGASPEGMRIEFKDVTLSYPSSVAVRPAVRNFSCTIEPGQLVVIVGENGSGKSSLIRLLTGASELTDGALLVDGVPVKDYDMRDLRNATALLSQEGENFDTLSVAEAVGVGRWHRAKERDLVERAIDLGGATDLVKKLSRGIDTILQPVSSKQLEYPEPNDPLWDLHSELETAHQLSGGEKQRMIAARTFMRILGGDIKLVLVDEPSSAMDPAAERALFANLRDLRSGKTMIFITHKFGYLTQFADVILCMKDGELAESGSHDALLQKGGEYCRLYQVQARGFAASDSSDSEGSDTPSTPPDAI